MRERNVVSQLVSSMLVASLLFTSVAPALVSAQEAEHAAEAVAPEEAIELPETDHSDNVTKNEVKEALETMPELLGTSDDLEVTRDADSAIIVQTEESSVDIPKDPEDGVTLGLEDGTELTIELPNADEAKNAKRIAPGVVAYPAADGSANAVQADESGGVRMLTIIDNADAPTEYEYKVTVPDGGRIELLESGGIIILDVEENVIATIDVPWAKDANQLPLQTWFTTDGTTITQHIIHTDERVAYPVTADPWLFLKLISHVKWSGGTLQVYPTFYSRYLAPTVARWSAWEEVKKLASGIDNRKMADQFYCHWDIVRHVYPFKSSWNLDTWRPDVGYLATVRAGCNPN